jgi:hypothetical protein
VDLVANSGGYRIWPSHPQLIESIQVVQKLAGSLDTGDSHGGRPEKSDRRDYLGRAGRPAVGTKPIDQF